MQFFVRFLMIFGFASLLAQPAFSQTAPRGPMLSPLDISAYYRFEWGGIPFGEMVLDSHESGGGYVMQSQIQTVGLARVFKHHKSINTLTAVGSDPVTSARTFDSRYKSRKKAKAVHLEYKQGGAVKNITITPPENPAKRAPVPAELSIGSLDPLSYVLASRRALHDTLLAGGNSFNLRLFDGRRLMDTAFTVVGVEEIAVAMERKRVIKVNVARTPVAGFTSKENADALDDPIMHIYFSDDDRLLPLRLSIDLLLGTANADLINECGRESPCRMSGNFSEESVTAPVPMM